MIMFFKQTPRVNGLFIKGIATSAFVLVISIMLPIGCIDTLETVDHYQGKDSTLIHRPHPLIDGYSIYYGAFHNHCNVSDGTGTPHDAYYYAKYTAHLDFFGLSDHDYNQTEASWKTIKAVADSCNEDSAFAAFWGFEWTSNNFGHLTIVNTDDFCVNSTSGTTTLPEICSWLATGNGIAIFNHPGRQNSAGTEFNHFSGSVCEKIVGMELWNKTDPFSVYYYNDGYDSNDNKKGFFDEALSRGWKIGAAGGFDSHNADWGTETDYRIALLAKNLTKTDLLAALQARRFYSTLDKNITLSFTIGGQQMGSKVVSGPSTLQIKASDHDFEFFTEVVLFDKSHSKRRVWNLNENSVDLSDTLNTSSGDYYYVKIKEEDGDEAISSPIWVSDTTSSAPGT
jgi:hypothetical protein